MDGNKDLFTFPKEISDAQKYKQLGNSVAIPVIYEIANSILEQIEE
ncbi:MAG: DNA cytosine methyltransferase [Mycoplasmatales bacterium]